MIWRPRCQDTISKYRSGRMPLYEPHVVNLLKYGKCGIYSRPEWYFASCGRRQRSRQYFLSVFFFLFLVSHSEVSTMNKERATQVFGAVNLSTLFTALYNRRGMCRYTTKQLKKGDFH